MLEAKRNSYENKKIEGSELLVIDNAVILGLVMAAIVFADHGLNAKIPSLF
jgi:hypothetical protein